MVTKKKKQPKNKRKEKRLSIGGQAVMEGVMMKSEKYMAVAVRKSDDKIVVKKEKLKTPNNKMIAKLQKLPFTRGVFNLFSILILGIKTLLWSASQALEEEGEELSNKEVFWLLFLSIGFALFFFVALPYFLTSIIGVVETSRPILFNLIDGIIKITLFIGYVAVISLLSDIKRLFQYHGAEHKSVYCFEKGLKLTVPNIKVFTTKHPRCGTSFIMIVLIISIFIFTIIPVMTLFFFPGFINMHWLLQKTILFPIRLLFVIPIAGISYEMLRLGARFENNPLMKILVFPGILVQYITTKEPDNKQIEVAARALKEVLKAEGIND